MAFEGRGPTLTLEGAAQPAPDTAPVSRFPSRCYTADHAVAPRAAPARPARRSAGARAQELAPGARAPEFSLAGSDGREHRLSDLVGKRGVVLAWFPKAFTAG